MRVLLDENIPHDLIPEFHGHDVLTVQGLGWAGVKNGDLLTRARGQIDALLTMDRKLERQQTFPCCLSASSLFRLARIESRIFFHSSQTCVKL